MSPEVEPHLPPVGFSSAVEDLTLSRGDLDSNHEPGRTGAESRSSGCDGKTSFLKLLIEAEAAASSAAIQLVSFRHAEDGLIDPGSSTKDKRRMARQRGLLLEKLEDFRQINKSLRQKLRRLQASEADRIDAEQQMDSLMKKMAQAERENERLKKDLNEMEKQIEELISQRREQQEEVRGADLMTKSADAANAHMQGQLRSKEAENRRLTSQLQTLERTVVEQKMVINDLRASMNILNEKASEDRESLKKATRAQKRRAERFEAAIEKCYAQLKEKEAQLTKARTERDSRRQQKEQMTNGKDRLQAHIEILKSEIADLTLRLQKAKNDQNAADETVKRKADKVMADNNDLLASNAALKASVTRLEQQLADCESALVEEKILSQEKKLEVEQCQFQAAELQAELDHLRLRYANLLRETQKTKNGKEAEVEKVRRELQGRVEALTAFPELLSSAEQSLLQCQESLQHLEKSRSEKSQSVQKLHVKVCNPQTM
uniref:Outer dense fiber protein 2-like n=1 Tax=Oryzias melastigma TaxID=30732 RepID=A0A3B3BSN1_ORYME